MTTHNVPSLPLNILGYVILELLERKPLSGYDVKKRFFSSLAFGWHAHVSQLYSTLRQLEQRGYVTSQTAPSNEGPERRIYAITLAGHEVLLEWLQSPLDDTKQKNELLLRVWAADLMPTEAFTDLLTDVEQQTRARLNDLIMLRDKWQQRYGPPEAASDVRVVGSLLCMEHDIQLARAKLTWLERASTVLQTRALFDRRKQEPNAASE
ncbi:MAG: PadR family transcriptional regulator, partial [Oscillochloris sp.]|nr:PadR family transcriptional regulator [Oscillochloris sp.]